MVDPLNSDAAARALTDALAAPGTPEELSREAEYVAMFLAVRGELRHGGHPVTQLLPRDPLTAVPWSDAPAAPADDPEPSALAFFEQRAAAQGAPAAATVLGARERGPGTAAAVSTRRRRRRRALVGGLAAVAITGTAAAVSTTLVNQSPERPPTSTGPLPGSSGTSSRTPRQSPAETLPGGATRTAGTGGTGTTPTGAPGAAVSPGAGTAPGGGPTTVPPAGPGTSPTTGPDGSTTTPAPTPSTTTEPPPPTSSPSPSDTGKIPHGRLVSACKQFEKGKLDPSSPKYQLLLGLAGSADKILAYCKDVVGT